MHDIVVAGMIRSGSTLVYRTVKELFPGRSVHKTHDYIPRGEYRDCVFTTMDPVDATISLARVTVEDDNIPDRVLEDAAARIEACIDIGLHYASDDVLILDYQKFVVDSGYLFTSLEREFHTTFDEVLRRKVAATTGVADSMAISSRLKSFKEFDPETHIHGRHVRTPMPGDARRLVRPEVVSRLEEFFQGDLRLFGYLPPTPR
jgi:hypothetical protein